MEIKIDPSEEYFRDVFAILKNLKYQQLRNRKNQASYTIHLYPPEKRMVDKQVIFQNIETEGVVSWDHENGAYGATGGQQGKPGFTASWILELELKEPKFSELYKKYKIAFGESGSECVVIHDDGEIELYLEGSSYHHKFGVNTHSFNLLHYLAEYPGQLKTFKKIEDDLGYSSRQARDAATYLTNELGYKGTSFLLTDNGFKLLCAVKMA